MAAPTNGPGDPEYYKAAQLYQQGRLCEAEEILRRGIKNHLDETERIQKKAREHPWCNSLLGVILSDRGQLDEAERHLRIAAEAPSSEFTDPGIVRNLAVFLLERRNDPKEAEAVVRRGLEKGQHPELFTVLGYELEKQKRTDEARDAYEQAIRRSWPGRAVLGFLRTKGEVESSITALTWELVPRLAAMCAASFAFLVLLVSGSVRHGSLCLPWLPLLTWTRAMQVALLIAVFLPWVLPPLLNRLKRITWPGGSVELFPPSMGPQN